MRVQLHLYTQTLGTKPHTIVAWPDHSVMRAQKKLHTKTNGPNNGHKM